MVVDLSVTKFNAIWCSGLRVSYSWLTWNNGIDKNTCHFLTCHPVQFRIQSATSLCLPSSSGWTHGPNQCHCWRRQRTGHETALPSAPPLPFLSPRHLCLFLCSFEGSVSQYQTEAAGSSCSFTTRANGSSAGGGVAGTLTYELQLWKFSWLHVIKQQHFYIKGMLLKE